MDIMWHSSCIEGWITAIGCGSQRMPLWPHNGQNGQEAARTGSTVEP